MVCDLKQETSTRVKQSDSECIWRNNKDFWMDEWMEVKREAEEGMEKIKGPTVCVIVFLRN